MKQEAKPLIKEDGGDAMILEPEEKKNPRTLVETESHKSERNCDLKHDLDKSDPVAVVNKHHVQKQPPQQQLSVPNRTSNKPFHLSLVSFLLVRLVSVFFF